MSDAERSRLLALQSAPLNSWIALSDDESRIVAIGASYEEATEKSESLGIEDPVILKTSERGLPLSL